jgi:hypothetical protein
MRTAVLLAAALVLASCKDSAAPAGEIGQVLLEIEYVNYAWTPTFYGFVLEADGNVYSYDRDGQLWENTDNVLTEAELRAKVATNRMRVGTRDGEEVSMVSARIAEVEPDQLTDAVYRCADAGVLSYRAYRYNRINRSYQPIVLRSQGDLAQQNLSSAAQALIAYVRSLNLQSEFSGCGP